jgi:hypothetical protein
VDGDGKGDLLVGDELDRTYGIASGAVHVVDGSTRGQHVVTSVARATFYGAAEQDRAGWSVAGLPLDGPDGIALRPTIDPLGGERISVFVYQPADGPLIGDWMVGDLPTRIVGDGGTDAFARELVTGDVDGDGQSDLLTGDEGWAGDGDEYPGAFLLFRGPFSGTIVPAAADVLIENGTSARSLGKGLALGDSDGDGTPEIAAGWKSEVVITQTDWAAPLRTEPAAVTTAIASGTSVEAASLASDLDDDGYADLAVGGQDFFGDPGQVLIWFGPVEGTLDEDDATMILLGTTMGLGESLAGGGDVDRDGVDDLVIGAWQDVYDFARSYVLLGSRP